METRPLRADIQRRRGYRPLFFVFWGFALWLITALVLRLYGQTFLVPNDHVKLLIGYYGAVPVVAAVQLPLYRHSRLTAIDRLRAATLVALPGLMLSILTTLLFARAFPNLPAGVSGALASWLFWLHSLIVLSGLVPMRPGR